MTSVSTFRNPEEKNIAVIGIKLTKVPYICKRKPHSYHLYGFLLFYCSMRQAGPFSFLPHTHHFYSAIHFQINCAGCRKNFPSLPLLSFSFYTGGKAQVFFAHYDLFFDLFI